MSDEPFGFEFTEPLSDIERQASEESRRLARDYDVVCEQRDDALAELALVRHVVAAAEAWIMSREPNQQMVHALSDAVLTMRERRREYAAPASSCECPSSHYSRQTIGAEQVLAPGQTLLMLSPCELAVWGVVCNLDPVGNLRWRNTIFRNESRVRSSELIRCATTCTYDRWERHYGGRPPVPLTTEIDIEATRSRRSKRHEPGHCYLVAGWRKTRDIPAGHGRSAKVELEAPR